MTNFNDRFLIGKYYDDEFSANSMTKEKVDIQRYCSAPWLRLYELLDRHTLGFTIQ